MDGVGRCRVLGTFSILLFTFLLLVHEALIMKSSWNVCRKFEQASKFRRACDPAVVSPCHSFEDFEVDVNWLKTSQAVG